MQMQLANLAPKLTVCVQKQLVCFYMCWMGAAGIAVTFIILPDYQTLMQFQKTECTTVKVRKSGINPCTYCLQVFVATQEKPSEVIPLQHDEIEANVGARFG